MLRKEERGEINDLKFLHIKWEKEGQSNPGAGGRGEVRKIKAETNETQSTEIIEETDEAKNCFSKKKNQQNSMQKKENANSQTQSMRRRAITTDPTDIKSNKRIL